MSGPTVVRLVADDGGEIAATVRGVGPPVVLLPAGPGDADASWGPLVPHLEDHLTCYSVDTRGRGLSSDHPDHSRERLVRDVQALVHHIAQPVGLLGWGSSLWAPVAADPGAPIAAVAVYEPGVDEVMDEGLAERVEALFGAVGQFIEDGDSQTAVRHFLDGCDVLYPPADVEAGHPTTFWTQATATVGTFLAEEAQQAEASPASPTDPSILAAVDVPVLLIHGAETSSWFRQSVDFVASRLDDVTVTVLDGAGHFGPYANPAGLVEPLVGFFSTTVQ